MSKIEIMIVEDDPIWLKGISDIIRNESDFHLCCTAGSKEEAIKVFAEYRPAIILMDINLSENNCDGIELASQFLQDREDLKIIMLTSLTEEEVILDSFSAGAVNYLNKLHFKEIPDAVRAAFQQTSGIHPSAAAVLRKEFLRMKQKENENLLTPSEKEILKLIHEGNTQTEIEKTLFITKRTIKNHVNKILKKMGVKSSKDAAELAKKKKMF